MRGGGGPRAGQTPSPQASRAERSKSNRRGEKYYPACLLATPCLVCACPAGSFSAEVGSAACELCPPGGFCEEAGAATSMVWQACPAGTYNAHYLRRSAPTCTKRSRSPPSLCSAPDTPHCCPTSRRSAQHPRTSYHRCYLKEGYTEERCTSPNGWIGGENTPYVSWGPTYVYAASADLCKLCPANADCSAFNTTLESLGVPRGYWRASSLTTELHECVASNHCSRSGKGEHSSRRLNASASSGGAHGEGCDAGHTGPLCEWCTSETEYFSRAKYGWCHNDHF